MSNNMCSIVTFQICVLLDLYSIDGGEVGRLIHVLLWSERQEGISAKRCKHFLLNCHCKKAPMFCLKVTWCKNGKLWLSLKTPMHYGIRAMGTMTLRIWELCLSFPTHPNISDGNFNLAPHFFHMQIFQINEKGVSWAWSRWWRRRKWK